MEKRRLGRTGHMSSLVIMGAAAFWEIDQEGANKALDLAQASGINHIDVAPQYGNAQTVVGPWLESRRDKFFLGCKTLERKRDDAWKDLQNSLKLLRTHALDLYQMHAICTSEELDQAFAPGGVIEAFIEARDQGLTRYLGITGHGMLTPAVQIAALERFNFDTVMFPLNPRLYADLDYRRDAERLLRMAGERDVGVMIIKAFAKAPWGDREKAYNPWYEPHDAYEDIEPDLRFALSQPAVTALTHPADVRLLPVAIKAAERFTPMDETEQAALIERRAHDETIFEGAAPRSAN